MSVREEPPDMVKTDQGWAVLSDDMPPRGLTNLWMKTPERHLYVWDGDGWFRINPPEKQFLPAGDLPHG